MLWRIERTNCRFKKKVRKNGNTNRRFTKKYEENARKDGGRPIRCTKTAEVNKNVTPQQYSQDIEWRRRISKEK